jgi:hypothetical protein
MTFENSTVLLLDDICLQKFPSVHLMNDQAAEPCTDKALENKDIIMCWLSCLGINVLCGGENMARYIFDILNILWS